MSRLSLTSVRFERPGGFVLDVEGATLDAGETLACIGPSGCGKSTLLELCAGLLVADEGSVAVDGLALETLDEAARRRHRLQHVGLVFQGFALLAHLDVLDNLLLPWSLGQPSLLAEARAELPRLAEALGLAPLFERKPSQLSMGERQRVAVCRALLGRPRLLLADEPTGSLDAENAARVVELCLTRARELQAALVFVTHDQGLLGRFDRVLDLGAPR